MRRGAVVLMASLVALASSHTADARDGWEVGFNTGAVVPLSKYRKTVEGKDVGGTFGLPAGYRWYLNENMAISLIGQPQFTFLPTESLPKAFEDGDFSSMFIYTAGPKVTFFTEYVDFNLTAQGGYYRDMSGPMDDQGGGFNAGGGAGFRITPEISLGLFARYDYSNLMATPVSDNTRQFVLTGFQFVYDFSPQPEPPPAPEAPPPPAPVARKIILRGVNFDFDMSNIRPDARPILDAAIETLQQEPDIRVTVEGYTDWIGTDAYNLALSDRRAQAVVDYLVAGGISPSRLTAVGFGESDPVATNETESGRAQNRRVELRVLGG